MFVYFTCQLHFSNQTKRVLYGAGAQNVVSDETPGYMDVPQSYMRGREARRSIDLSEEGASDYLCVVVPKTANEAADMFK